MRVRFWMLSSAAWVGVMCYLRCVFGGGIVCCVVIYMFVFVRGYRVFGVRYRFAMCRAIKYVVCLLCIWYVHLCELVVNANMSMGTGKSTCGGT